MSLSFYKVFALVSLFLLPSSMALFADYVILYQSSAVGFVWMFVLLLILLWLPNLIFYWRASYRKEMGVAITVWYKRAIVVHIASLIVALPLVLTSIVLWRDFSLDSLGILVLVLAGTCLANYIGLVFLLIAEGRWQSAAKKLILFLIGAIYLPIMLVPVMPLLVAIAFAGMH